MGRSLERLRMRCKKNVKMDLREIYPENVKWMELMQGRAQRRALVLSQVLNIRVLLSDRGLYETVEIIYFPYIQVT
jgi:hypothetical protein